MLFGKTLFYLYLILDPDLRFLRGINLPQRADILNEFLMSGLKIPKALLSSIQLKENGKFRNVSLEALDVNF